MNTCVFERFPKWPEQITLLLQQDADFDEMCSDYQELADWPAARGDCVSESVCAANRDLLRELETEILDALQGATPLPADVREAKMDAAQREENGG